MIYNNEKNMDKRKVYSFEGILGESSKRKLQESKVEMQVDWWDQCIAEVLEILRQECYDYFSMERLLDYVRTKDSILGRTISNFDDSIVVNHIKDLIFSLHGNSIIDGKIGSYDINNVEIYSKALAIEELAYTILGKVKELADPDNSNPTCKVKLYELPKEEYYDEEYDEEDEFVDDLISCERKNFLSMEDYTQLLKESTAEISIEHSKECLKYVMDKVENNDRFDRMTDSKAIRLYLCELAKEYLNNKNIHLKIDGKKIENVSNIKDSTYNFFAKSIASEAMKKILKRKKQNTENEKTE